MLAILLAISLSFEPAPELQRGLTLAGSGDLKGAAEQLERVAAAFPGWGLAQVELAEVMLKEGADEPALEKVLAASRALEPLNPRAWLLSGRFHERRGDKPQAIDAFARAAQLRPDLLEPHERLGALLLDAGRCPEAADHLRQVVEARRDDRTARANLADAYERSGELASAEKELRALVQEAPRNAAYRRRLVDFLERNGQGRKAAAEARRIEPSSPVRQLRPLR